MVIRLAGPAGAAFPRIAGLVLRMGKGIAGIVRGLLGPAGPSRRDRVLYGQDFRVTVVTDRS
jgi:hypothetical protein